jgi:hypothetical protein
LKGEVKNEDYTVEVVGEMIDLNYPATRFWRRTASSKERPDARTSTISFAEERKKPIEAVQSSLRSRGTFVSQTLAQDFQ